MDRPSDLVALSSVCERRLYTQHDSLKQNKQTNKTRQNKTKTVHGGVADYGASCNRYFARDGPSCWIASPGVPLPQPPLQPHLWLPMDAEIKVPLSLEPGAIKCSSFTDWSKSE